jgi:hypothetical protein
MGKIDYFCLPILIFSCFTSSGLLYAETNYPPKTQTQIAEVLRKDIAGHLLTALQHYNGMVAKHQGVTESAKKVGFSSNDITDLNRYIEATGKVLPKAEWEDGEIRIQESGHVIAIGTDEYLRRAIRVNGKSFSWNWEAPVASNIDRYNKLFDVKNASTSWLHFSLVETASADELFRIKAAGLQLYFVVTATGEMGGQLYRLNDKVKEMVKLCEAPEPPAGQNDPFLKAVMEGTAIAQKFETSILLKNCNSIKEYSKKPFGVIQGKPVFPKIPADLCGNLDRLAKCVHQQMDPPAASNKSKKDTPPPDKEEWYEPQQKSKGTADAAK